MISIVKRVIALIITNSFFGIIISKIYSGYIPNNGNKIYSNYDVISNKTKAEIFFNIYEGAEIKFIKKYFKRGYDVIEFGSSIGVVSCLIKSLMDIKNKLVCVEASPTLFKILNKNLEINQLQDNSNVVNYALTAKKNSKQIFFNPGMSNTTGNISQKQKSHNSIKIKSITINRILNDFNFDKHIMVMDIEGAEIEILLSNNTSFKNCKLLFIELHRIKYDGILYNVDDMINILIDKYHFSLLDRNDNVCVFNKI